MSSSLKVSMAGFEVNLVEFAGVISDLVSVNLDQESKDALKTLIGEARKCFDVVVDVITPLYALNTPVAVRDQFPALRVTFKNAYFKNSGEVRTHCHIVNDQIERLKQNQGWLKRKLPAFDRLVQSQAKWVGNDDALADAMSRFLDTVNEGLDTIDGILPLDATAAYQALVDLLAGTETRLKGIKVQLDDLTIISNRL